MNLELRNLFLVLLVALFSSFAIADDCKRVTADVAVFDKNVEDKKSEFEKIPENPNDKKWVKSKILHMVDVDQYLRTTVMNLPWEQKYNQLETDCFWKEMGPRWQRIDSTNTNDLSVLMKIYSWFKISEFGQDISQKAWLLAQHADLNRPFQKEVLSLLEKLYPVGEALPRNYAYLYDRVTWYGDGKPQRYATQGQCHGPNNWQPHPTEDLLNVDTVRASMGIEPLAEKKKVLDQYCH